MPVLSCSSQSLEPSHQIDIAGTATTIRRASWIVYSTSSTGKETRVGNGYATGTSPSYTYTLINPVSITKTDLAGRVQEKIQATRASSSGKLLPTDTFAQTTYTRWSTTQYTDCCYVTSQRVYHSIPATGTGTEGTNYDETAFGYDSMKRRNRTETPGGTITFNVFDSRGLVEKTYTGTDDTGATSSDPTGGGATGNNMMLTTTLEYDSGNDGGDGKLTKQTQHVDSSTTRVTTFTYDFRDRRTDTDGEVDFYEQLTYDNLDRITKFERFDTTSTGNLIAKSETKYDDRGRVYQSVRYGVNPSTGTVGNSLTDNTWYDASGNVIKQLPAGSEQFSKTAYDSLGRPTTRYAGYDLDETTYADAGTVTGDTIMEQSESTYDDASNVIQSTSRQRYHNAPASQTGVLKNPTETPKARVTYVAKYPDALGRGVATANYGTNGGTALVRSSTIPTGTDDILVSQAEYDSAGNMELSTDPSGMVTSFARDDLGRETSRTMNPQASPGSSSSAGGCEPSVDTNVTIETSYNADGNVHKITAKNAATGDQVTEYVYGTTLTDSEIASSLLKRAEVYPDSVDVSDRVAFEYNRQSQVTKQTDQGGTVHEYDFDKRFFAKCSGCQRC
jgi:YD repeat-containing protein